MDLRKVKKLIELLENSALLELEITEGESTIRLSRAASTGAGQQPQQQILHAHSAVEQPPATRAEAQAETKNVEVTGQVVESPLVGTFYDAPSPDAQPYVKVGTTVGHGDVLCIIEAMKTFNQLEADVVCIVKAVYKSSGDPVEYGEPLFLIE